ncbi:MAG: tRNA lysidine(34) synthetase TilS [Parvularculales bacterium]
MITRKMDRLGSTLLNDQPLNRVQFDTIMDECPTCDHLAVAISGGADSLALLLLLVRWRESQKWQDSHKRPNLIALTVNHGLRKGTEADTHHVAALCQQWGVPHHVLRWIGSKPRSNIQAKAREARYHLMMEWCDREGVEVLGLAHHLEDQAETVLLRLARGSGVDGLAAMARMTPASSIGRNNSVVLWRPLLGISRAQLRATLKEGGVSWREDPTNNDTSFARVRMRALMGNLADEGLTPARLAAVAQVMARTRKSLEVSTQDVLRKAVILEEAGYGWLTPSHFSDVPDEISLRALAILLMTVSGSRYRPRLSRLESLHECLVKNPASVGEGRTLAGCRLVWRDSKVLVLREATGALRAPPLRLTSHGRGIWDGRYDVALQGISARPIEIRALGTYGFKQLVRRVGISPHFFKIPPFARSSLPALWREDKVLTTPCLDMVCEEYKDSALEIKLRRPLGLDNVGCSAL